MTENLERALIVYAEAKAYIEAAGLRAEVEWQRARRLVDITESDFLRESAWVVLCSGFRESIVRKIFDYVSLSFCDWESARAIASSADACRAAATAAINNQR